MELSFLRFCEKALLFYAMIYCNRYKALMAFCKHKINQQFGIFITGIDIKTNG